VATIGDHGGVKKHDFGGTNAGTAEFDRKVGAWISTWVRHLGAKGTPPERLALLIYDELHEGADIGPFLAWAKAIRAVMYAWFNKHLKCGLPEPIVEEDFQPLSVAEMGVWDTQHPMPLPTRFG
jgi:hypothetical protein